MPGHEHARPSGHARARPVEHLDKKDIQPRGNAAAAEDLTVWEQATGVRDEGLDAAGDIWEGIVGAPEEFWVSYAAADEAGRQQLALDAWQEDDLQDNIDALSLAEITD